MHNYDRNYDTMTRDRHYYDRERNEDEGGLFSNEDDRPRYSAPYSIENRDEYRDRDRSGWFSDRSRREERNYGPDQRRRGIPRDETAQLIASNKVEGTPVYGRDREKLGSIHNFMVEKRSGKVRYAVMKTSSGFLGLDERYYPLDWNELDYDTRVDGYHVNMTEDDLERRRSFDSSGRENSRSFYGRDDNDYMRSSGRGFGRSSYGRDYDSNMRYDQRGYSDMRSNRFDYEDRGSRIW